MSDLQPWAVFWNEEARETGVIWAETRKEARRKASRYGGVAAITDEPQEGGWNIDYDEPEHYLGRYLGDTFPVGDLGLKSRAEGENGE